VYQTSVQYVSGHLSNTSNGINHFVTVGANGTDAVDGLIAMLNVKILSAPSGATKSKSCVICFFFQYQNTDTFLPSVAMRGYLCHCPFSLSSPWFFPCYCQRYYSWRSFSFPPTLLGRTYQDGQQTTTQWPFIPDPGVFHLTFCNFLLRTLNIGRSTTV
jgi:hypothetical protein